MLTYEVTSDRLVGRSMGEQFTTQPTPQLQINVAAGHLKIVEAAERRTPRKATKTADTTADPAVEAGTDGTDAPNIDTPQDGPQGQEAQ